MSSDKKIVFYGLSTCPYCKRAKEYIEGKNLPCECIYIYVDTLSGDERKAAIESLREYNSALSFPTIVVMESSGDHLTFVGFTDKARESVDAIAEEK